MITRKKNPLIFLLLLGFGFVVFAQQKDTLSQKANELKTVKAENISLDTLSIDMQGLEQMEEMQSAVPFEDMPLSFTQERDKNKYGLQDHQKAAEYDSLWMKELYEAAALFDDMYDEVASLDANVKNDTEAYILELPTDTLKARLEKLNQKTPFNVAYNASLESVIRSFLKRKSGLMERMITVSQFYFPLFEQQLDNYDIPIEMKYLAIVESALNPRARSRVGATGLWQFMYGTGKMYKLDVNSYVDERRDPIKATEAACKYLSKLYGIFGDWDLALAAYNSGPGNVNKAIRRSGGYTNYWNIRRNLPRETAGYVPAFLATMYLFEYAEEHGLSRKKADRPYFVTDTVRVKSMITFDQISKLTDVSVKELELLNPSYKLNVIPYVDGEDYALRLPKDAIGKFVANETQIYAFVKKELESKESPLPKLVAQAEKDRIRYKVRSGDFLGKIAERYGVRVSQIKQWNGLRSNNLRIGQRLTIYPRNRGGVVSKKATASVSQQNFPPGTKLHTVRSGDSLWTISRKYPGISVENLKKWNGISGKNLKPGTKLKLCECPS
ncbi:LysM peptidoglycan-binding domain-containing protein [Aggregatimonas sangjinii]|uniref:LysM peptidoglycan-binding domain-containing protein n=1 Tax=Aggregatimonas sangjinii TaxID=2583587 RepID=A0A5B7ST72_9FLAO|nr:LysM peptidoglycan-binding domain-containing protein [Aggregatimonas sangjinii]QCX01876.1 LysM peptidoglycan-binding domain-containing protein [Aggregatimonas sangjinii]